MLHLKKKKQKNKKNEKNSPFSFFPPIYVTCAGK